MLLNNNKDLAFKDILNKEFELRKLIFLILTLKINIIINNDWIIYIRLQNKEEFRF